MPIYVYTCSDCGFTRDVLCKSHKDAPQELGCSMCECLMFRDYSAEKPSFHLKGGCWGKQGYEMSDTECLAENERMLKEDEGG